MTLAQRTLLALLCTGLVGACSSPGRALPPRPDGGVEAARTGHGEVLYQGTPQLLPAVRAAQMVDDYYLLAADRLGYRRKRPVSIWIVEDWGNPATTFKSCVIFRADEDSLEYADLILAHEFVHWHAHGTVIQENLPWAVVEGICEHIASKLVHEWRDFRVETNDELVKHTLQSGSFIQRLGQLELNGPAFLRLDRRTKHELTAIAFFLVEELGLDALRAAAEAGPTTAAELLHAAGVKRDGSGLPLLNTP